MRSVWTIFTSELRLLGTNLMTLVICLGLIFMPSLFTWYNVLSCWNVFDNSGSLTVAVANSDAGYKSDLLPLEVNLGDNVVSALRENTQIGWVFVDEEEAVEGAASGKYYAAVVIPENFSTQMLTFYQDDGENAELVYYANQKKNAISPKITGQGADTVSYTVNTTFAETVNELVLTIADSMTAYLDTDSSAARISALSQTMSKAADRVDMISQTLALYGTLADSSQSLLASSATLLGTSNENAQTAISSAQTGAQEGQVTVAELRSSLDNMSSAIDASIASIRHIGTSISGDIDTDIDAAVAMLTEQKAQVDSQIASYQETLEQLQKLPIINAIAIWATQNVIDYLQSLSDTLSDSIYEIQHGELAQAREQVQQRVAEAEEALDELRSTYQGEMRDTLDSLSSEVAMLSSGLESLSSTLSSSTSELSTELTQDASDMSTASQKIGVLVERLNTVSSEVRTLSNDLNEALVSGDLQKVRDLLGANTEKLASALAAPVSVERNAIYPSENFGSSMLPFYSSIALFIGALLIMVLFKPQVSPRVLAQFPKDRQPGIRTQLIGHFGVMAVLSLLQTTVLGAGSIFFLQAQVEHPLLFMLCFWVSGLVFTLIMYALVTSFANVGKAIGVLLLIVQVTGSGGSFPLSVLPQFVQNISEFLPAYHIVNAMRAAMFGTYMNDFWTQLGIVAAFIVPVLLFILIFARPLRAFITWYGEKAEESKLLS